MISLQPLKPVRKEQWYDTPSGRLAETHLVRLNLSWLRTLPVSWRPLSQRDDAHLVRLNQGRLRTLPVRTEQRIGTPSGRPAETHLVRLNLLWLRTLPVSWRHLSQRDDAHLVRLNQGRLRTLPVRNGLLLADLAWFRVEHDPPLYSAERMVSCCGSLDPDGGQTC